MKKHVICFFLHVFLILCICSCSQQIFPGINNSQEEIKTEETIQQEEKDSESNSEKTEETEAKEENSVERESALETEKEEKVESPAEASEEENQSVVAEETVTDEKTVIKEIKETIVRESTTQETTNNITGETYYNYYGCDELLNLDEVLIQAKAYPGVNLVSWKPVNGANGYLLYKYEEGFPAGVYNFSYDDLLIFYDTDISDETEYTYVVEAESKSSPSRAVFVQNTSVEISVKAIVPPGYVSARNLCGYEDGFNGEIKQLGIDESVVDTDNFVVSWKDNHLAFSFPAKAYLSYDVYAFRGNEYTISSDWKKSGTFLGTYRTFINNKIISDSASLIIPGSYTIGVVISSLSNRYVNSEMIEAEKSVTVPVVNLLERTSDLTGSYIDEGKTVRIKWKPAILEDQTFAALSNYSVYSYNKKENIYTKTGSTKSDGEYYYSIIPVDDSSASNEYFVVLSVNGAFEYSDNVITIEPYVVLQEGTPVKISDFSFSIVETETSISATGTFYVDLGENQQLDVINYAAVDKDITEENLLGIDFTDFIDFKTCEADETTDYKKYKVVIDELPIGKKLAINMEVKEDGRKNAVTNFVSDEIVFEIPECTFEIVPKYSTKVKIRVIEKGASKNYIGNYRYDIYYAETDENYYLNPETEWITLHSGSLEFTSSDSSGGTYDVETEDLKKGNYIFKLEKKWVGHPEVKAYTKNLSYEQKYSF